MRKIPAYLALAATLFFPASVRTAELIPGGTFDKGQDTFWGAGGVTLSREKGKLCANVEAGGNPWERLLGVSDIRLTPDHSYRLAMTVESSIERKLPVSIQRGEEPWTPQANFDIASHRKPQDMANIFRATESNPAQIIFQIGGAGEPWRLCLDDVSLRQAKESEIAAMVKTTTDDLTARVNQAGYFADGPKRATIISGSQEPLAFKLANDAGIVVGEGLTAPKGFDETAGASVHVADFSAYTRPGHGYRLIVDGKESHPFSIGDDVYGKLRVDALSWFYPQRSGIEIRGDIAGQAYARPAGHVGESPNLGDTNVSCLTGEVATKLYGADWHCSGPRDVSGGWYDAGDQGKYVVNGAIAAAQLLGTFERGRTYGGGSSAVLSDSLSRIPENGNGVPDVLDEARWELEFLLKMVVPDGEPLAGMAYHKVHDVAWTGIPMLPHLDPEQRALHRPSTAATLDLAAVAAQGARLFASYDPAFSEQLLETARKAWLAAAANPVLYAPVSDGKQGGGDYDDASITDEIYWAAAELYLTTGEKKYLSTLKASPFWAGPVFSPAGAFDWRSVAGLARVNLALYGHDLLPDMDKAMVRDSVVSAASEFLALQKKEPFGHIYRPRDNRYDWGSNQLILQNMIVLSAAYDLTGERRFLDGVRESMDYILGRNVLNTSYITGYGAVWPKNQHSRWYAHQLDASLPNPPVGSLAGGANVSFVDEVSMTRLKGCAPQACYLDDIMSYGTNEITINWNAPLVYIASFLADTR